MKRDYHDMLTFSKECVAFGKKLGYHKVLFSEINYCEPRKANDIKTKRDKINIVKGGSKEVNQAVVRNRGIDVLLNPVNAKNRLFDTAMARMAKEHGVAIGVSLDLMLGTNGSRRISLMRNLNFMIQICKKMKTDVVIVSGARDIYGMRAPLDLASVGVLIGLDVPQARWAISRVPEAIIKKAKV